MTCAICLAASGWLLWCEYTTLVLLLCACTFLFALLRSMPGSQTENSSQLLCIVQGPSEDATSPADILIQEGDQAAAILATRYEPSWHMNPLGT